MQKEITLASGRMFTFKSHHDLWVEIIPYGNPGQNFYISAYEVDEFKKEISTFCLEIEINKPKSKAYKCYRACYKAAEDSVAEALIFRNWKIIDPAEIEHYNKMADFLGVKDDEIQETMPEESLFESHKANQRFFVDLTKQRKNKEILEEVVATKSNKEILEEIGISTPASIEQAIQERDGWIVCSMNYARNVDHYRKQRNAFLVEAISNSTIRTTVEKIVGDGWWRLIQEDVNLSKQQREKLKELETRRVSSTRKEKE